MNTGEIRLIFRSRRLARLFEETWRALPGHVRRKLRERIITITDRKTWLPDRYDRRRIFGAAMQSTHNVLHPDAPIQDCTVYIGSALLTRRGGTDKYWKAVIAHELAHVCLFGNRDHDEVPDQDLVDEYTAAYDELFGWAEVMADDLVESWGFFSIVGENQRQDWANYLILQTNLAERRIRRRAPVELARQVPPFPGYLHWADTCLFGPPGGPG